MSEEKPGKKCWHCGEHNICVVSSFGVWWVFLLLFVCLGGEGGCLWWWWWCFWFGVFVWGGGWCNFYFISFLSRDLQHSEPGFSRASGRKEKLRKPVTRWCKQSTSTSLPAHGKTQLLARSPRWNGVVQGEDKPCGSSGSWSPTGLRKKESCVALYPWTGHALHYGYIFKWVRNFP